MNKNDFDWIFFDLDDTLIASSEAYISCYRELNLEKNKNFISAKNEVKNILPRSHTSSHHRLLYFKKKLEIDEALTPKILLCLNDRYEYLLKSYLKKSITQSKITKALELLSKHFKLGIITNETCRTQLLKIQILDPNFKYFSLLLTSEEIGVEKPNLFFFKEALRRAKTKPSRVLIVGDSYKYDIAPAKKLKIKCIQTTQFKKSKIRKNVQTIGTANDLFSILGINH